MPAPILAKTGPVVLVLETMPSNVSPWTTLEAVAVPTEIVAGALAPVKMTFPMKSAPKLLLLVTLSVSSPMVRLFSTMVLFKMFALLVRRFTFKVALPTTVTFWPKVMLCRVLRPSPSARS